jgi:hypothetical protein
MQALVAAAEVFRVETVEPLPSREEMQASTPQPQT